MAIALLDQQRLFAESYVRGWGNGTQAAIEAGYSPVSARQTASRLLHTPHVQDAIRRAQAHALKGRLASKALGVLEKRAGWRAGRRRKDGASPGRLCCREGA